MSEPDVTVDEQSTDEPAVQPTAGPGAVPADAVPADAVPADAVPADAVPADAVLAAAVELARAAAVLAGGDTVGAHQGIAVLDDLVLTHAFEARKPGYQGWFWTVTVTRVGDAPVTVDEVVLLPGAGALLAPTWVPWDERVRPGDLSPGDLLPPPPDDPRLVPGYLASEDPEYDDPAIRALATELGLGRERVLSRQGRLDAAQRWQDGDHGPDSTMARHAPARCGTCGFFLALGGSLQGAFGACGNEFSGSDAQVVSVEFGCGAHSATEPVTGSYVEVAELVYDDGDVMLER